MLKRAIHWFRRDLRLADNTALREASRQSDCIIPVGELGVSCQACQDIVLHAPEEILKADETPYRVYPPYATRSAAERESLSKFVAELAWREFYMQILAHFPEVFFPGYPPPIVDHAAERHRTLDRFKRHAVQRDR